MNLMSLVLEKEWRKAHSFPRGQCPLRKELQGCFEGKEPWWALHCELPQTAVAIVEEAEFFRRKPEISLASKDPPPPDLLCNAFLLPLIVLMLLSRATDGAD
jgi:hypothetical protein